MINRSPNKTKLTSVVIFCTCFFSGLAQAIENRLDNQLSEQEKADGWQLLFDGKQLSHWRNFKSQRINEQWKIIGKSMQLTGKGGGDLISKKRYENFELKLDWKVSKAGNSGIFIMADELGKYIYSHAVEVQILDNERHPDNKIDSHLAGSIYDLVSAPKHAHKPAEQWNSVRIRLLDKHLQVWQNEVKTADIVIGSEDWLQRVANSKFATWSGFALTDFGHIGLQDHGDKVSFKNIKIKEIR